jgi:hypothetical protein
MGQNHKSCRVVSYTAYGEEHSFWSFHTAEQFWTTMNETHCVSGYSMCHAAFPYNNASQIRKIQREPMFHSNWYKPPSPVHYIGCLSGWVRTLEEGTAPTKYCPPMFHCTFLTRCGSPLSTFRKNASFGMICTVKYGTRFQSISIGITRRFTNLQLNSDPKDCQNFSRDNFLTLRVYQTQVCEVKLLVGYFTVCTDVEG